MSYVAVCNVNLSRHNYFLANKNLLFYRCLFVYIIKRTLHGGLKIWILFSSGKTIFYERPQRLSHQQLKRNGLIVHWRLYNKYNLTWPLGDTRFLFKISSSLHNLCVRCAHSWNIFQHSKRNFVSPRSHEISSIYTVPCAINFLLELTTFCV